MRRGVRTTFARLTAAAVVAVTLIAPPVADAHTRSDRHYMRRVAKPYSTWLKAVAWCESRNQPRAVDRSGAYTGLYQFDDRTWQSVGGHGRAGRASRLEQSYRAVLLRRRRGSSPWPVCGGTA